MTNVRRRVALVAGTMLLAGAAGSGVAMASTPPVVHPSVQTNYCDDDWGCGDWGYGHGDHGDHGYWDYDSYHFGGGGGDHGGGHGGGHGRY
ncbi:hypothetical protein AB0N14_19425 [Streptomyces sp. NPDC051104]|uniref:hypothetical protein n=1 Tax=Streptomyces sp. NPDC051104 TaxID=3155044 RepID=UPI0034144178